MFAKPLGKVRKARLYFGAALNNSALLRSPGADSRRERPRFKVGIVVGSLHFLDSAFNTHLPFQFHPMKKQACVRRMCKFTAFTPFLCLKKDQARPTISLNSTIRAEGRPFSPTVASVITFGSAIPASNACEPTFELTQGVCIDFGFREGSARVFCAQIGQFFRHNIRSFEHLALKSPVPTVINTLTHDTGIF